MYMPTDAASSQRRRLPDPSQALRYSKTVSRKKSPERTSRRSVSQPTDSARSGWTAKKSVATIADRRSAPSAKPAASRSKRRAMK